MKSSYLIWASVLLFLLSCALPVMTFRDIRESNNDETWYGWGALLLGWFGPMVNNYAWFANVFWLLGSLFLVRPGKVPIILLGIAVFLALTTFLLPGTVMNWNSEGAKKQASAPHYGAYVWIAAMLAQFGAAFITRYK